jgi:hypothetical protein
MKVLMALCLFGLSIMLFAQQNALSSLVDTQPKAHFVTSGEWPLKWISQTFSEEDQLKEVLLQNTSNRTVVGFQLGWAIFIPDGCGVMEAGVPRRVTHLGPYEQRMIRPGETVTAGPYHLSGKSITALARHAHSPAVVAQIGLYRVRYGEQDEMISGFEQAGSFGPESSTYPCESTKEPDVDVLHTFTSPDGAFQFSYSGLLVHCMERGGQAGAWEPSSSCAAYFPVCDEPGNQGSRTIACFAYPRNKFIDAPTFEAATFSVAETREATTEKDCIDVSPEAVEPGGKGVTETINGVTFDVFETSEAGMSQGVHEWAYISFHGHKCYQLSIRMATASSGAFEPDSINEFTKEDDNEVQGRLQQVLHSFRFLK